MAESVVVARNLTRRFGTFTAVDRVSFTIQAGEVVGYLGPNGSGKTTTIRMLLGLLRPSEGEAQVLGYDVVRQSEQVRAQVGYMCQKFGLYPDLTVQENLAFYAGIYGVNRRPLLQKALEQVGLEGLKDMKVSSLAVGWRQRLALATAMIHQPRLLFLDEPTSGVDPTARRAFWDLIYSLVAEGITALVTTHYMDEAEYCGRIGIMRQGRLLAMDSPSSLKKFALPGIAWDVFLAGSSDLSLLSLLDALEHCNCVLRAGLSGDHLRAITFANVDVETFQARLAEIGIHQVSLARADPTLEDVFLALATPDEPLPEAD